VVVGPFSFDMVAFDYFEIAFVHHTNRNFLKMVDHSLVHMATTILHDIDYMIRQYNFSSKPTNCSNYSNNILN